MYVPVDSAALKCLRIVLLFFSSDLTFNVQLKPIPTVSLDMTLGPYQKRVKPSQVLLGEVVKCGWIGDLKGGMLAHSLNFAVLGTVLTECTFLISQMATYRFKGMNIIIANLTAFACG